VVKARFRRELRTAGGLPLVLYRGGTHGFVGAAVQYEDDPQRRAIITTEFGAVRTPARIAELHHAIAVVTGALTE
jgi:hypothetical protein